MARTDSYPNYLTDVADSIRDRSGTDEPIPANEFDEAIREIDNTEYIAGDNITIVDNVISAIDTTYTAGDNITISEENVISANTDVYTAGDNISISEEGVISATDTRYTAGSNITISDNVISTPGYTAGDNIYIDDQNRINNALRAGYGIEINNAGIVSLLADMKVNRLENGSSQINLTTSDIGIYYSNTILSNFVFKLKWSEDANEISITYDSPFNNQFIYIKKVSAVKNKEPFLILQTGSGGNSYKSGKYFRVYYRDDADNNGYSTIDIQNNSVTDYDATFQAIPKTSVIPTANSHLTNKQYVDGQIATVMEAIGQITSIQFEIVTTLPQEGDPGVIYLVEDSSGSQGDVYKEYIYVNNTWECLGSTNQIDLSSYATITYVDNEIDAVELALSGKQATLTAGSNIAIDTSTNTISATDTTYTAGTNITIDANNQISATDTTYTAGDNITINGTTISADKVDIITIDVRTPFSAAKADIKRAFKDFVDGKDFIVIGKDQDSVNSRYNSALGTMYVVSGTYYLAFAPIIEQSSDSHYGLTYDKLMERVYSFTYDSATDDLTSGTMSTAYKLLLRNGTQYPLGSGNTSAYTPTADSYNPATTKYVDAGLAGKQNTLIAGTGITIDTTTNTISATGGGGGSDFTKISTAIGPTYFPAGDTWYMIDTGGTFTINDGSTDTYYPGTMIYASNALATDSVIDILVMSYSGYHLYEYSGSSITDNTVFSNLSPIDVPTMKSDYVNVVSSVSNYGQLFQAPITFTTADISVQYSDTADASTKTLSLPANTLICGTVNNVILHNSQIMIYRGDNKIQMVTNATAASIHIEDFEAASKDYVKTVAATYGKFSSSSSTDIGNGSTRRFNFCDEAYSQPKTYYFKNNSSSSYFYYSYVNPSGTTNTSSLSISSSYSYNTYYNIIKWEPVVNLYPNIGSNTTSTSEVLGYLTLMYNNGGSNALYDKHIVYRSNSSIATLRILNVPDYYLVKDLRTRVTNLENASSGTSWGNITGTLSDQTDLQNVLTNLDNRVLELEEAGPHPETYDEFGSIMLDPYQGYVCNWTGSYWDTSQPLEVPFINGTSENIQILATSYNMGSTPVSIEITNNAYFDLYGLAFIWVDTVTGSKIQVDQIGDLPYEGGMSRTFSVVTGEDLGNNYYNQAVGLTVVYNYVPESSGSSSASNTITEYNLVYNPDYTFNPMATYQKWIGLKRELVARMNCCFGSTSINLDSVKYLPYSYRASFDPSTGQYIIDNTDNALIWADSAYIAMRGSYADMGICFLQPGQYIVEFTSKVICDYQYEYNIYECYGDWDITIRADAPSSCSILSSMSSMRTIHFPKMYNQQAGLNNEKAFTQIDGPELKAGNPKFLIEVDSGVTASTPATIRFMVGDLSNIIARSQDTGSYARTQVIPQCYHIDNSNDMLIPDSEFVMRIWKLDDDQFNN